jgi:hypothetical protein
MAIARQHGSNNTGQGATPTLGDSRDHLLRIHSEVCDCSASEDASGQFSYLIRILKELLELQ